MAKKIKIKIKDVDNLEFEILEKAEVGDFFNLKEFNNIDFSFIEKQFSNKQNEIMKKEIEKEKINWKNEFKSSEEYKSLENQINNQKNKIETLESQKTKDIEIAIIKVKNETQTKILDLENQIKNFETTIENEKLKISNAKNEEIENLKKQIYNAEKDKELIEQKINYEWEIKWNQKENDLKDSHRKEKEEIERKRLNAKEIGEDLENWIQNEFDQTFGMIDGCKLEKANKIVGGHKPDFIFSVYDNETKKPFGKVTIEAKTQKSVTDTTKKNRDHFEKLEMDRKNNNSEFALLISELEPDEIFYIKKAPDERYENMFIVRPAAFIAFLSIVRYIWIKEADIVREEINFENKQKILEKFEEMKNEILSNSIRYIQSNLDEILKLATDIEKDAIKIKDKAQKVIDSHLNTIKSKIENFKIRKIVSETEKI